MVVGGIREVQAIQTCGRLWSNSTDPIAIDPAKKLGLREMLKMGRKYLIKV